MSGKMEENDRNMQGIERRMRKLKQNQEMKGEGKETERKRKEMKASWKPCPAQV